MSKRYFFWFSHFRDKNQNDIWNTNNDGKTRVEELLSSIIYQINSEIGNVSGRVDNENIWLLRQGSEYEYITYFKVTGENVNGYSKEMFN